MVGPRKRFTKITTSRSSSANAVSAGTTIEYVQAMKEAKSAKADPEKIFNLLQNAARKNDVQAICGLATWYYYGRYVNKDLKIALKLARRAALLGSAEAMHYVAVMTERGEGLPEDATMAFNYYTAAAILGDKAAIYEVSRMLRLGVGTSKNLSLSKILAKEAQIPKSRM